MLYLKIIFVPIRKIQVSELGIFSHRHAKPIYKILAALNDTKKIWNTLILLVFAKFKALIDALEFNDPFRQNVENLCRFFVILWTVVRTSQTKSAKPHFCRQSVHIEMQGKLSVSQCTIYWHSILFWRKYVLLVSSKLSTF